MTNIEIHREDMPSKRQAVAGDDLGAVASYEAPVIRELGRFEDLTQGGGGGDFDPGTGELSKGG